MVDLELGNDCVAHAKTFFNRPDFNLDTAKPGTFTLAPSENMAARLIGDYKNTEAMIFGEAPSFDNILASIDALEDQLNQS
ncbi:hypothetical protein [Octadecabacter arcticus]|uniref:hypothetical protein n=1 Tax=Octadecabacter arcticus TaxID=53946 RepID=UPI001FE0FABF